MVGGGGEGKNCFTSDSQTYNTCKKINKRVMEKTGCLVTTLMLFLRHSKNHTRAPGGKGAAALHHFWSPGAAQSEFKQSWYLAWYFSYQETNGDWVREEFKYQPLPSLETLLIITQFKIPGSILTSDLKPIFEPGTCYSSLEFNTSLQSSLKEKQLSNLKHQLNLVVKYFSSMTDFWEERYWIAISLTKVWFFWQVHNLFKCFRCRTTHTENCIPTCLLFPKKVITVWHC